MLRLWTARQSRIVREEDGAGMVEYALLIALVALALIIAIGVFAGALSDSFSEAGSKVAEA